MKKYINTLFLSALIVGFMTSCNKDVLDPTLAQDKVVEGSITTAEDVEGVLYGAYNRLTTSAYYGRDLIIFNEIRSDNAFSNGNSGRFLTPSAMDMGKVMLMPGIPGRLCMLWLLLPISLLVLMRLI